MLSEILKALLITSLAGTCLTAVITMAKPVTKKIFGYAWHYYIWLAVIAVLLLPVRFTLPQKADTAPVAVQAVQNVQTAETVQNTDNVIPAIPSEPKTDILGTGFVKRIIDYRLNMFAYLWLTGAIMMLLINLIGYIRLIIKMRKHSVVISCPQIADFTRRKAAVRVWENTSSPFMTGIFKPTLVLPEKELTEEQLKNILRHEMTHFKRHDILYKWLVSLVKCLHWFHPVVWYVAKQINTECEISCDMAVTQNMNRNEEMSYINTILALLPMGKTKQIPLTTQMASSKKVLKRRFEMIRNKRKTSKFVSALSAVIAVVMLGTTVFASGVLSGLTTGDYTIEITNNGEKIELINKPFIENDEVYVPLRETIERVGFEENNSHIVWDNGKIYITVAQNGTAGLFGIGIGEQYMNLKHIQASEIYSAYSTAFGDQQVIASFILKGIPILRNSNTYIPIKDINYMLYSFFNVRNEDNSLHELSCNVYDKNGNEIDTSFGPISDMEADKIIADYENKQTKCYEITNEFFSTLKNSDINAMKQYCTNQCKSYYFNGDEFYGMKSAVWHTVYSIRIFTDGRYYVHIGVKSDDLDGGYGVFFLIFDEQEDGGFLISDIKNSYKDEWELVGEKTIDAQATIFDSDGEIVFKSENLKNPELTTIEGFFQAFAQSNFALMKNYCTQNCTDKYFRIFDDGSPINNVYDMTTAELITAEDSANYEENKKMFHVTVKCTRPAHSSLFDPDGIRSFSIITVRQPNGRYLIDEFATGL